MKMIQKKKKPLEFNVLDKDAGIFLIKWSCDQLMNDIRFG